MLWFYVVGALVTLAVYLFEEKPGYIHAPKPHHFFIIFVLLMAVFHLLFSLGYVLLKKSTFYKATLFTNLIILSGVFLYGWIASYY